MRELYIYYRVRSSATAEAKQAVAAMQRELRASHPGLQTRLLRRSEQAPASETWMEVYASNCTAEAVVIGAAFEAELETRAEALAEFTDGQRHTERFEPFEPSQP
ncbi:MAG: DUF4936 family protein [Pseudomonadota bacterium]|nr:DUF4936 family protein [Pseudomonadota bacterium]